MKQINIIYKLLFISILSVFTISHSLAQSASSQGRDFWFSFLSNQTTNPTQTCLILSAERACSVTVNNPSSGWSTSVSIPANGRVDVNIPFAEAYYLSSYENTVRNLACHLVATDDISAYTMNYKDASFDGAHLLPTEALADYYMIESIPPGLNGSTVLIIGTENGTVVDITPTSATNGGWAANTTHTINLNAGQVYQFTTSSATASLSGTVVQSHDCKKIAVFAGCKCAQAPAGCTYCDHIYEPMIPTIYWGNHFAVTSSLTRNNDVIRVTVLNNNTTVSKNGSVVTTLNAGGTYDFQLTSAEGSCYIETSGPSVCYEYLTGQSCGGGSGDPSMVYITPIEQNIRKITFGTYYNSNTSSLRQYVNIITATNNVSSVTLDGNSISNEFNTLAGNANYSYARLNISHATHTLQCDSGLVAHVYGLGNVTSYAYNVGSSTIDLSSSMYINNVNTADIPEDQTYCPSLGIDFEVGLNYGYDNITWYFGDGGTGTGNPTTHTYETPGTYHVIAIVERSGANNCFGTTTDTLRGRVNIPPTDPIVTNVVVCGGGSYEFFGNILTEPGIYFDTIQSSGDCDSVIELHLSFVPADPIPVFVNICAGSSYDFYGRILTEPGIYLDTITTSAGCDSIVELHLSLVPLPTVNLGEDRVLCGENQFPVLLTASTGNDETYLWNTGATTSSISASSAGMYSVTVTSQYGCTGSDDMIIRLQDQITVSITASSDFCEDGGTTLTATTNAPNLVWNTGATSNEIEVIHSGTYSVLAYEEPCEETATIDIPACPFYLYFPNCITPTYDDGVNDVFYLTNPDIVSEFEIFIYDRWGMLVFHSTDPHFRWDGKHKGKIAANNVFSWKAFATPYTEQKKRQFTGSVLVL